jgi:hypothetical protein
MPAPSNVQTLRQKGLWMVLESHPLNAVVQNQNEGGKLKVIAMKRYSEGMGSAPEIFFDKPELRRQRVAARHRIGTINNVTREEITTNPPKRRRLVSLFAMLVPQRT